MNDINELGADMELQGKTCEECVEFILDELESIKDGRRKVPIANTG